MRGRYRLNQFGAWMGLGFLLTAWLYFAWPAHAAAGRLYVKADDLNASVGEIISLNVRADTGGDLINSVQANLTYPADRLDYLGTSSEGSAFPIKAEEIGGNGKVSIARGSTTKISGDQLVALVRFKVKAASGKAVVAIAPGSALVRSSDNANILSISSGATLQLAKTGGSSDMVAPQITNLKVEKSSNRRVAVTWSTDEPASSQVEYGIGRYYLSVQSSKLETSHNLIMPAELLEPNAIYQLRATSIDASGNLSAAKEESFLAPGLSMALKVLDSNGLPLVGARVSLGGHSHTVGPDGSVVFDDLVAGDHEAEVKLNKQSALIPLRVEPVARPSSQEQTVKVAGLTAQKTSWQSGVTLGILLLIVFLAALRRQQLMAFLKKAF